MCKSTIIFFLILINILAFSATTANTLNRKYCGNKLNQALKLVCRGHYNSPPTKKALNDLFAYNEYEEMYPNEDSEENNNQLDFPTYFQKEFLLPMKYQKRHLPHGGIVEECCNNPCSVEMLSQYCA